MGWCGFGKPQSPRFNAIKHQPTESQILRTLWLRSQVELRLTELSKVLILAIGLAPLRWRGSLGREDSSGGAPFDVGGAGVAQCGMTTVLVVPTGDKLKDGQLRLATGWPHVAVD
jgi:hypothetical protein